MKLIKFIYYMATIIDVLILGILWGAYIEGAEIPLFALTPATACLISWVIIAFFAIKE